MLNDIRQLKNKFIVWKKIYFIKTFREDLFSSCFILNGDFEKHPWHALKKCDGKFSEIFRTVQRLKIFSFLRNMVDIWAFFTFLLLKKSYTKTLHLSLWQNKQLKWNGTQKTVKVFKV